MFSAKEKNKRETPRRDRRNRNIEPKGRFGAEKQTLSAGQADKFHHPDPETEESAQTSWDDMVFQNRNRDYGAYVVRKGYVHNLSIAFITTFIVVIFTLSYPTLMKWLGGDNAEIKSPPRKLVYTELSAPPPIDKPKPPPPNVVLPKLQKVIKFVPPKVVREQVAELPPSISEIRQNEIAAVAVEGPADITFDEPVSDVVVVDDEIFTVVDQQPEYAGGYEAMIAFIKQNMVYPPNARRMQIEGTVHVSFIVGKTGEISDVKVLRGISTDCDREAVRVVEMMPRWTPGKQNGRPVNVRFIMPLKFRLN